MENIRKQERFREKPLCLIYPESYLPSGVPPTEVQSNEVIKCRTRSLCIEGTQ